MCAVPDSDLFTAAISQGKAEVVTDQIERFTKTGILLKSGRELPADIIVTATGLKLLPFGGIQVSVDGQVKNPHDSLVYKPTASCSRHPEHGVRVRLPNSSWTLKVDLVL